MTVVFRAAAPSSAGDRGGARRPMFSSPASPRRGGTEPPELLPRRGSAISGPVPWSAIDVFRSFAIAAPMSHFRRSSRRN